MFRSLTLMIVLVCGALGLACNNDPTSTQPPAGPTYRTANNPNGPGACVIRFETTLGLLFVDPASNRTVIAGLSLDQLAALCAGGNFTFEPATEKRVFRPDGSIHQLFKAKNVTLLLYDVASVDFCAVAPFAVGRGNFTGTDNDLTVSGNRTNSFGFRLRGRVAEDSGERHHMLAKFHALITRSGVFREITSQIKLN
jgi:hypothetical protein